MQWLNQYFNCLTFTSSSSLFHEPWTEWNWCATCGLVFNNNLFSALWLVMSLWNYHWPLQRESSLAKVTLIYRHKHNYLECVWQAQCAIDFLLELMIFPVRHFWLCFQYQMWIPFSEVSFKFNEVVGSPITVTISASVIISFI